MDDHLKKYLENLVEHSSSLLKSLSEKDPIFHKILIRTHVEDFLNLSPPIFSRPIQFKEGLDWINVEQPIHLDNLQQIIILHFFTYCCVNCLHILPQLKALESKYSDRGDVVVIGVHSPKFANEHSTENVRAAVRRYGITHPVVNDPDEHLWNLLGITCWPTLVVVGPHRRLLLYLSGETHQDVLNLAVEEALKVSRERNWIWVGTFESNRPEASTPVQSMAVGEQLFFPGKVTVTKSLSGQLIAIADTSHHRVLVVNPTGEMQYVVGSGESGLKDGNLTEAQFHSPQGLAFADPETLYVADTENHAVRKVDFSARRVETVVGTGVQGHDLIGGKAGREQPISSPWDLTFLNPTTLLIAMAGSHQIWAYFTDDVTLWKKDHKAGTCAAVVGSGREENRNNSYPLSAGLAQPSGLTITTDAQTVYVADSESSTVRAVSATDGKVTGLVGGQLDPLDLFAFGDVDGKGREAKLQHPLAVAWSEHTQSLYICDSYNHKIKVVDPASRLCSTYSNHEFNEPGGICAVDNLLYVADTNNHSIKIVDLDTMVVHNMILKSKLREEKKEVAPMMELEIEVSTEGGLMDLHVFISVADDIKPLPDNTAEWMLTLPKDWQEENSSKDAGSLEKSWKLRVPAGKALENCRLTPQCKLFYCRNNLCSRQILPFRVTVTYSDNAPMNVTCPVKFTFTL